MTDNPIDPNINIVINIDPESKMLEVNGHSSSVDPLLMRLLMYFYQHKEQIISRETLCEKVWLSEKTSNEAINRGISRVRKLLGSKRDTFIKTVPKQGYMLTVPNHVEFLIGPITDITKSVKTEAVTTETVASDTVISEAAISDTIISNAVISNKAISNTVNQTAKVTPPNTKLIAIFSVLALIILTVGLFAYNPQTNNFSSNPASTLSNQTIKPISLHPITGDGSPQQIPPDQLQAIHSRLNTQFELDERFSLIPTSNPYDIFITLARHSDKLIVNVSIKHKKSNTNLFDQLTFAPNTLTDNPKSLIDEIAALTRLKLTTTKHHKRLLNAYDPLSYRQVEMLVNARNSGWYTVEHLPSSFKNVSALNQQYPNNPHILGVLSRLNAVRADSADVNVVTEKNQQLTNAQTALALAPQNFDALHSAFMHNRAFAQHRHKAVDYANLLKRFHPSVARTWRNQLMLMIDNKMPCEKISVFIKTIPSGLFKPHRLTVIEKILSACINQQPPQQIYQAMRFLPNDKTDIAIINNINLFNIRHDHLWRPDNRASIAFNMLSYYQKYFSHQMQRADKPGAQRYLQNINASKNRYWQWHAQVYLSLYNQGLDSSDTTPEQQLWRDEYLPLLHDEAQWYFAANLIKKTKLNGFDHQRLINYFAKRPSFAISVRNVKESIAQIMLLHKINHHQQMQTAANQLYIQLEQNYQASPNSFTFWNLGRYHLLAKLYCGQNCQKDQQTPQQYLAKIFSPHHIWWLDDHQLMTHALKPFKQKDIATVYLDNIIEDKKRMQMALGL